MLDWDGTTATLVEAPTTLTTDLAIAHYIADHITAALQRSPAVAVMLAVDAPLTVPNQTGNRQAERLLAQAFGRYQASAYPANRTILSRYNGGEPRAEPLFRLLQPLGITIRAELEPQTLVRQAVEVYPHPAMVTLFGLTTTLHYKARYPRDVRERAFATYQAGLRSLADREPACLIPPELLQAEQLRGSTQALKTYEDRLDAILCAYVGLYYWYWGAVKCRIFGSTAEGHMIVPIA